MASDGQSKANTTPTLKYTTPGYIRFWGVWNSCFSCSKDVSITYAHSRVWEGLFRATCNICTCAMYVCCMDLYMHVCLCMYMYTVPTLILPPEGAKTDVGCGCDACVRACVRADWCADPSEGSDSFGAWFHAKSRLYECMARWSGSY